MTLWPSLQCMFYIQSDYMKIKIGKLYTPRDMQAIEYIRVDAIREELLHDCIAATAFMKNGDKRGFYYYLNGSSALGLINDSDLHAEYHKPIKVSGWVNVYDSSIVSNIFATREEADHVALVKGYKQLACVYVEGAQD